MAVFLESKHIEWSIQNFFEQPKEDNYKLESTCFFLSDAVWTLKIYTNGETLNYSTGYISLFLLRKSSTLKHAVTARIGIKKTDGSEFKAQNYEYTFASTSVNEAWGYPKFIKRDSLLISREDAVPNGTLTVFCTFRIKDQPVSFAPCVESSSQTAPSDGTLTLIEDLKNLYLSSRHSDVTIRVKDKEFSTHRSILSSRSSVFESMFSHNTLEKNSGVVEITDCDPNTFKDCLIFLYTGKFDNVSSNNAVSLYMTADKYDLIELKEECVRCMVDEISNDIFCDVFHLATMQNEKELLKAVTEYFIKNAKTIVTTVKWQTFLVEHPLLGNELFYSLLNSKDNDEE